MTYRRRGHRRNRPTTRAMPTELSFWREPLMVLLSMPDSDQSMPIFSRRAHLGNAGLPAVWKEILIVLNIIGRSRSTLVEWLKASRFWKRFASEDSASAAGLIYPLRQSCWKVGDGVRRNQHLSPYDDVKPLPKRSRSRMCPLEYA